MNLPKHLKFVKNHFAKNTVQDIEQQTKKAQNTRDFEITKRLDRFPGPGHVSSRGSPDLTQAAIGFLKKTKANNDQVAKSMAHDFQAQAAGANRRGAQDPAVNNNTEVPSKSVPKPQIVIPHLTKDSVSQQVLPNCKRNLQPVNSLPLEPVNLNPAAACPRVENNEPPIAKATIKRSRNS